MKNLKIFLVGLFLLAFLMPKEANAQPLIYCGCETLYSDSFTNFSCDNQVQIPSGSFTFCWSSRALVLGNGLYIRLFEFVWSGEVLNLNNKLVPFRIHGFGNFMDKGDEFSKYLSINIGSIGGVHMWAKINIDMSHFGEPIVAIEKLTLICRN